MFRVAVSFIQYCMGKGGGVDEARFMAAYVVAAMNLTAFSPWRAPLPRFIKRSITLEFIVGNVYLLPPMKI